MNTVLIKHWYRYGLFCFAGQKETSFMCRTNIWGREKNRADSEGEGVLHMTLIWLCLMDTSPLLAFRNENRNFSAVSLFKCFAVSLLHHTSSLDCLLGQPVIKLHHTIYIYSQLYQIYSWESFYCFPFPTQSQTDLLTPEHHIFSWYEPLIQYQILGSIFHFSRGWWPAQSFCFAPLTLYHWWRIYLLEIKILGSSSIRKQEINLEEFWLYSHLCSVFRLFS